MRDYGTNRGLIEQAISTMLYVNSPEANNYTYTVGWPA